LQEWRFPLFDAAVVDYFLDDIKQNLVGTDIAAVLESTPVVLVSSTDQVIDSGDAWPPSVRRFSRRKWCICHFGQRYFTYGRSANMNSANILNQRELLSDFLVREDVAVPRILIVDDDPIFCRLMAAIGEDMGVVVEYPGAPSRNSIKHSQN
jgi:hypothetical protein